MAAARNRAGREASRAQGVAPFIHATLRMSTPAISLVSRAGRLPGQGRQHALKDHRFWGRSEREQHARRSDAGPLRLSANPIRPNVVRLPCSARRDRRCRVCRWARPMLRCEALSRSPP